MQRSEIEIALLRLLTWLANVGSGRGLKNLQVKSSGVDQGGGGQQARSAALKAGAERSKKTLGFLRREGTAERRGTAAERACCLPTPIECSTIAVNNRGQGPLPQGVAISLSRV